MARRLAAVRAAMDRHDVSHLVVYGAGRAPDVQYLANWPGTREAYLVVPRQGEPTLLVQFNNHVPNARRTSLVRDVRWAGNGSEAVVEALSATGARRIGVVGAMPWSIARRIGERVPALQLVDLTSELRAIRSIASAEELELLREAARITDLAMAALEHEVRPGLHETELAGIVESAIARAGGTPGIHFMATTPMRAPEIGVPSQIQSGRVIAKGDVLITEITAHHWSYGGQIHRAYAIGEDPTDEYRRIHDAAVETYQRICGVLRDGATVADVLDAAEVARERGYTTYDDLLHGTDQLPPILQTRDARRGPQPEDFVFREDMVVVVQPNLVRDASGTMGLQVGETVRVTRKGIERLHRYPMRFVRCG
jgi:Xaa-Pro dipeptidase/ectoine hydrolase